MRAFAIRWLRGKGIESRQWKGLDVRRVHFACRCSILKPHFKARHQPKSYNPGYRSRVCDEHQRALGDGRSL